LSKRQYNHFNKEGSEMKAEEAHRLCRGDLIRLNGNVAGKVISCGEGILWLTQTGTPGDHLMQAGEAFSIGHPGVVLISALEDSVYAVSSGNNTACSVWSLKSALWSMACRVKGMLEKGLLT
jgi:hypothetical protein